METIRVEKNGIEDDMSVIAWEMLGADNNKDGWRRVSTTPVEVIQIKSKRVEAEKMASISETPEGEVVVELEEDIQPIKAKQVKSKGKK